MTRFTRSIVALLVAGALLATAGAILNPRGEATAAAEPASAPADRRDPVTGLQPISRIIDFWQQRVDRSPSDYLSRTELGNALLTQAREQADLDRYADAGTVFADALELNSRHAPAQLGLARSLQARHRFADALEVAERITGGPAVSRAAAIVAADALWELGSYVEAASRYDDLLSAQRSAPLLSRAAAVSLLSGDADGAVELASEALALADEVPQRANTQAFYRFQLAHFLHEAGDVAAAITWLEDALAVDAHHLGALEMLASIQREGGDLEAAAEHYALLLELGPAADLHGAYADVQRALGDLELADEHEAIAYELAAETIHAYPAERRHVAGFFLTRNPAMALELALADLDERQDVGGWELLAEAHDALGDAAAAADARAEAARLRAELVSARPVPD